MKKTKIGWCDSTLNPVVGCRFNCPDCYARKMNDRFKFIEHWNKPKFFPERLQQLNCKTPKNIFMNSMSDIADWSYTELMHTMQAMRDNPQHNYLFLTKRAVDASWHYNKLSLGVDNVWCGVTSSTSVLPIQALLYHTVVPNRFVLFEPLGNDIYFDTIKEKAHRIHWFIIGAETGNRKGKIVPRKEWIYNLVLWPQAHGYKFNLF